MEKEIRDLKDIITSKIPNAIIKSSQKDNYRVQIKEFNEILHKKVGELFVFYHPIYKNVIYLSKI
jgi:hypothetical protein